VCGIGLFSQTQIMQDKYILFNIYQYQMQQQQQK